MSGKGSSPRPFSVDRKTFDNNWKAIFDKKESVPPKDSEQDKLTRYNNETQEIKQVEGKL